MGVIILRTMERLKSARIPAVSVIMESNMLDKRGLLLPPAFEPAHHSIIDWDFHPSLNYSLYTGFYVEPPSCLRIKTPNRQPIHPVLSRRSNTLNLPEGQIHGWYRSANTGNTYPFLTFCNQSPLGITNATDCYVVFYHADNTWLRKYVGGDILWQVWFARVHPNNTWFRERVTWWVVGLTLEIQFDRWSGSEWVKYASKVDNTPSWLLSGVNRLGPAYHSAYITPIYCYYDEHYILGPS